MPAINAGFSKPLSKLNISSFTKSPFKTGLTLQQKKYLIGALVVLNLGLVGATVARDHTSRIQDARAIESMFASAHDQSRVAIKPVRKPETIVSAIVAVEATPTPTPTPTPKPATAVAGVSIERVSGSKQDWMRAAGIPENVWGCADALVTRESGWRVNATNASSGAYGLPQALPGTKMATAGADWQTNPVTQLRWMAGYVTKYGGWCEALAFQQSRGWY